MNISLPDRMRKWVQAQIKSGKYASSSDYIRDLIREHQTYQEKLQALRAHLKTGSQQAACGEFTAIIGIVHQQMDIVNYFAP